MAIVENQDYPRSAFAFEITVAGTSGKGFFGELSGLNLQSASDNSGLPDNNFERGLPGKPKYDNIVLKRGVIKGSGLARWIKEGVETFGFKPKVITITLIDESGKAIAKWELKNAYCVAMKISGFLSEVNGGIAAETVEFAYDYFTRLA